MIDLYYMQFSLRVLDVMKTARTALDDDEWEKFLYAVKLLAEEKLRELSN